MHVLGSSRGGRSFLVGYGHRWPSRPQHRLSSCPDAGACNVLTALLAPGPNAHKLTGCCLHECVQQRCCTIAYAQPANVCLLPPLVCAPLRRHCRAACPGALVSGPAADDSFDDDRTISSQSGVGLHHNVALVGLLGGLLGGRVTPGQCAAGRGAYQLLAENVLP